MIFINSSVEDMNILEVNHNYEGMHQPTQTVNKYTARMLKFLGSFRHHYETVATLTRPQYHYQTPVPLPDPSTITRPQYHYETPVPFRNRSHHYETPEPLRDPSTITSPNTITRPRYHYETPVP